MKVFNIVFYCTVFLSFVAWLVLLAGTATLGGSCTPLCRYFLGLPTLIICWEALALLLCVAIQVFSLHGLKVLAVTQLSILTTLAVIQTSEWLNRAQGLNGPSNDDYLFNIEGLFAAQNSIVCSCVLISMLNISLITQLGVSLADSWPSSKPASTSTDVGVQMSNSV